MMHRQLTMFTTVTMLMAAAVQAGFQGPDGQAYTHIVIEKDAPDSVKLAASEMQQFIGRLCGVQLRAKGRSISDMASRRNRCRRTDSVSRRRQVP